MVAVVAVVQEVQEDHHHLHPLKQETVVLAQLAQYLAPQYLTPAVEAVEVLDQDHLVLAHKALVVEADLLLVEEVMVQTRRQQMVHQEHKTQAVVVEVTELPMPYTVLVVVAVKAL
jgi:hypothetical protein